MTVLGLALGELGFEEEGVCASDPFSPGEAAQDFSPPPGLTTGEHRTGLEAVRDLNEDDGVAVDGLDGLGRNGETARGFARHDRTGNGG